MIIDKKTENNIQSQRDDIMNTQGISRKNDHITPLGFIVGVYVIGYNHFIPTGFIALLLNSYTDRENTELRRPIIFILTSNVAFVTVGAFLTVAF